MSLVKNVPGRNLFIPSRFRLDFLSTFGSAWKAAHDQVWHLVEDSSSAVRQRIFLDSMRSKLKPYDITIVGVVAEGGVGLQTSANPVHLAYKEGSPEAIAAQDKIVAFEKALKNSSSKSSIAREASRHKIAELVESLRKNGHPYASAEYNFEHKVIPESQILQIAKLSSLEISEVKSQGISKSFAKKHGVRYPTYLPYYKGQDGEQNRWLSKVEIYIDWSDQNVAWFKQIGSKATSFSGRPYMRNQDTFLTKRVTWNRIRSYHIKSRIIQVPGVIDQASDSISCVSQLLSDEYLCAFLNSEVGSILTEMISITPNTTPNVVKALPIVIPPDAILNTVNRTVAEISGILAENPNRIDRIRELEHSLDEIFYQLWSEARVRFSRAV
jgi:hypothetical protein